MNQPKVILGIDTSLRSSGYGVVEAAGSHMKALDYGFIKNKATMRHSACLEAIYNRISDLIETYRPMAMSIEGIFYSRNAKTAMILGQARGAVLTAGAVAQIPIYEYAPRSVKQAVVGIGSAGKGQVGAMIKTMLNLAEMPQEDAADALAVAICHCHRMNSPLQSGGKEI